MKILVAFLLMIVAPVLWAGDIEIKALYCGIDLAPHSKTRTPIEKVFPVALIIKNGSQKEITVPTANLGPSSAYNSDGTAEITFSCSVDTLDGVIVRHSSCEFLPVRLLPGEIAKIEYELVMPVSQEVTKVKFVYDVPEDFAKIYDFWSGQLASGLVLYSPEKKAK